MSITPLIDTEDACFDLNASRPIAKGDLKWRDALLVAHRVNSNIETGRELLVRSTVSYKGGREDAEEDRSQSQKDKESA